MKKCINILLTSCFVLCAFCVHAQMMGAAYYDAYTKPKFGLLVSNAGATADDKATITKDSLGSDYIRTTIVVSTWSGSSAVYETNRSKGLKQLVVIKAYPSGSAQPFITAADSASYIATLTDIFNTYPDIKEVVVDNEEQTPDYHTGPLSDYGLQLKYTYQVAHARDIRVSDGGIVNNAGYKIRVYQWLVTKYNQATADAFATNSNMTLLQIQVAQGNSNDATLTALANQIDTILSFKNYVDEWNLHYYENESDTSITAIATNVLRYEVEYLTVVGARPVICNECGQRNTQNATLVTNMLNEFLRCGLWHVQWWSGNGDSGALPLTDDSGVVLPNGRVFKTFVQLHN